VVRAGKLLAVDERPVGQCGQSRYPRGTSQHLRAHARRRFVEGCANAPKRRPLTTDLATTRLHAFRYPTTASRASSASASMQRPSRLAKRVLRCDCIRSSHQRTGCPGHGWHLTLSLLCTWGGGNIYGQNAACIDGTYCRRASGAGCDEMLQRGTVCSRSTSTALTGPRHSISHQSLSSVAFASPVRQSLPPVPSTSPVRQSSQADTNILRQGSSQ
jgi:hypothetical protein